MDAYSTRTVQVHEKERELARAWERRHGRAPTSRELLHIANDATLQSRRGKDAGAIDWDALARRWDATLGGELAGHRARGVERARPRRTAGEHHGGRAPAGPPAREAQARALAKALTLVSDKHPAWTRHDLLKQLALVMPPETRQMDPEEARELLLGLAEEALSGRSGEVVCLEAPRVAAAARVAAPRAGRPQRLHAARRRAVRHRRATDRWKTSSSRTRRRKARRGCPASWPRGVSAPTPRCWRRQLRGRAHDAREQAAPRGLRLDQAAAAWHALTSPRTVEVITGPAGTGKTRVLAAAAPAPGTARWSAPRPPRTPPTSSATPGSASRRTPPGCSPTSTDGRIPPGSLIVADEGSMISLTHLAALTEYAARNRCKLVLAGDQEQLAAVEGGGAMTLLADRLGYVQLAEPVRFTAAWERAASLRLREGDATALDDYDQHGRIRGAPPDQAMDQAARAYVASYLAGRDVLLMAADWARCRELSARIRDDLIHLGLVDTAPDHPDRRRRRGLGRGPDHLPPQRPPARGGRARPGPGQRGHPADRGDHPPRHHGPPPARPGPATGQRRFTGQAFRYDGYQSGDLAYAITGHSAQGATVHTGIALVTGTEDRQWLYPAMTRGTDANLAFVFTTPARPADPAPGTRPAPELDRYDRIRRERAGYPPPATPRPTAGPGGPARADRRARRRPQPRRRRAVGHRDPAAEPGQRRPPGHPARDLDRRNPRRPPRPLPRPGHGRAPARLPAAAVAPGPVAVPHPARRRTRRPGPRRGHPHGHRLPRPGRSPRHRRRPGRPHPPARPPAAPPAARPLGRAASPSCPTPTGSAYLAEIAAMMDDRTRRLGQHTAQTAPAWAITALGPVPADPAARHDWEHKAAPIAAYREMYGYDHPDDPIGPEPSHQTPDQRAAWHQAFAALGPADGPDVRAMPDGRLWLIRDTYAAETAWAPRARREGTAAGPARRLRRRPGRHPRRPPKPTPPARPATTTAPPGTRTWPPATGPCATTTSSGNRSSPRPWPTGRNGSTPPPVPAPGHRRRRRTTPPPPRPEDRAPALRRTSTRQRHRTRAAAPSPGQELTETAAWIRDLAAQHQAFRGEMDERQRLMVPGEDPDRATSATPCQVAGIRPGCDLAAAQAGDHPLGQDPPARRRARHRTRGR